MTYSAFNILQEKLNEFVGKRLVLHYRDRDDWYPLGYIQEEYPFKKTRTIVSVDFSQGYYGDENELFIHLLPFKDEMFNPDFISFSIHREFEIRD